MTAREYSQGVASLGFANGPRVVFRLNPNAVDWNFRINTSVTETVGGRVVQVLGASLSDLTIRGSFGERRGGSHTESRVYAERFLSSMKEMAAFQARDARTHAKMHAPAIFNFPQKNWRMAVYIKDLTDPQGGGSITHKPGKFSYDYVLTLMIHADLSDTSKILGRSNGSLTQRKDKAIASYLARISDGIGWHSSQFNGGGLTEVVAGGAAGGATSGTVKKGGKPSDPRRNKPLPV